MHPDLIFQPRGHSAHHALSILPPLRHTAFLITRPTCRRTTLRACSLRRSTTSTHRSTWSSSCRPRGRRHLLQTDSPHSRHHAPPHHTIRRRTAARRSAARSPTSISTAARRLRHCRAAARATRAVRCSYSAVIIPISPLTSNPQSAPLGQSQLTSQCSQCDLGRASDRLSQERHYQDRLRQERRTTPC